jgi:hypothetical protein
LACATTPSSCASSSTGPARATPGPAASPDLATIESLLQTANTELTVIAENTHPPGKGIVTGNVVLFDTEGNLANVITSGSAIVALPSGTCDVAIYAQGVGLYVTLEEEKDLSTGGADQRYYRNRQTCSNELMCRRTVNLDDNFSFLYTEYKPYNSGNSLSRVTLSYRCNPA